LPHFGSARRRDWFRLGCSLRCRQGEAGERHFASAGLNTFWIQRSAAEVPEELGFQASAVVKAITDLAPLLRG